MEIETFVLCDAAVDYMGKLSILGTFDTVSAASLPIVWPHCSLALRLRFSRVEEGEHRVRISFIDADGRTVVPPMEGRVAISFRPAMTTAATNLVLNIDRLKLERAGEYAIDLAVDGRQEKTLPLYVRLREGPAGPPARGS